MHQNSHRRLNPLTGEWVLVSPHRTKRPWQGKVESLPADNRPVYDPECYLCPGNTRSGGAQNTAYTDVYVFTNDFAALSAGADPERMEDGLLVAEGEPGICRVICFSPDHSLTLPRMSLEAVERVIDVWQAEYTTLGSHPGVNHVQIFENKGSIMGCSNPHPHGQIWAQGSVPNEVQKKTDRQNAYFNRMGSTLLADYLEQELASQERIVLEGDHFVALVPFWAVWPYETMLIPRRPMATILGLTQAEKRDFAATLRRLTIRYDNLFSTSFPYSAGIHQAPTDGQEHLAWHWHMSFYPPLLRSATVKKFMVGYEMFAEPQRDITPEMAAAQLRGLSEIHYMEA